MTGAIPTYQQIVDDIRRRIASGELQPGAPLPPRSELRRTYGVSRQPVEAALLVLRTLGLVVGWKGRGSYVTKDASRILAAADTKAL
jgi:DNA-binding GntR family transcriptional regulator